MTDRVQAEVEHRFASCADDVFDAWLQPETVRLWMEAALKSMHLPGEVCRVEIDPKVGGKFVFADKRENGEAVHWGYYREITRPERLVFTWFTSEEDEREEASEVTLTITPDHKGGCYGRICHSLHAKWADYIPQTKRGWKAMLSHVAP